MKGLVKFYDELNLESLKVFGLVCLALSLMFGLMELDAPLGRWLNLATALALLVLNAFLFSRAARPRHAQAATLVLAAIIFASIETDYLLGLEVNQDSLVQMLLLAQGVVLLRQGVQVALASFCVTLWGGLRGLGPAGFPSDDQILLVVGAALVANLCLRERRRLYGKLFQRGKALSDQRVFLERSLSESRSVREQLDARVEAQSRALSEALELREETDRARAELQSQLLHAHRIASVGRLAGGLAHLVNNKLTVILGQLNVYEEEERPSGDEPHLAEIRQALKAASELASRLLTVSGRQVLSLRPMRVRQLLQEIGALGRLVTGGATFSEEVRCPDETVLADPAGFAQVLQNLVSNASDASPSGGTVRLKVERRGQEVGFEVSDQGPGLPAELRGKIFEAFFTTKPSGSGTGVGLAIVATMVEAHQGRLELAEEAGPGACFRVWLPICAQAPAPTPVPEPAAAVLGGHETLLLVEDHAPVRALAARFLAKHGYRVLACGDGLEALAQLEGEESLPALVVSDIMMPGLDGPTLARKLLARHPKMRFLFVSGYADHALEQSGLDREAYEFLPKPYTLDQLARRIRELLDSK